MKKEKISDAIGIAEEQFHPLLDRISRLAVKKFHTTGNMIGTIEHTTKEIIDLVEEEFGDNPNKATMLAYLLYTAMDTLISIYASVGVPTHTREGALYVGKLVYEIGKQLPKEERTTSDELLNTLERELSDIGQLSIVR